MAVKKSNRNSKLDALMSKKSVGTGGFRTDVVGYLVELQSPSDNDREETYEFEGELRPSTWTAKVRTPEGLVVSWNWPGFLDEDGDNLPGINIIKEGVSISDLMGGQLARFYRDPKSRRSTVTPVAQQANGYVSPFHDGE